MIGRIVVAGLLVKYFDVNSSVYDIDDSIAVTMVMDWASTLGGPYLEDIRYSSRLTPIRAECDSQVNLCWVIKLIFIL